MQLTWSSLLQTGRQNLSKSITSSCSGGINVKEYNEGVWMKDLFFFLQVNARCLEPLLHTMCPSGIISFWWKFARKSKYSARPQLQLLVFMFLRNIWFRDSLLFVQSDCNTKICKHANIRQITNTNKLPIPTNHQYQQIINTKRDRNAWFSYQAILAKQVPHNNSRSWSGGFRMYHNK